MTEASGRFRYLGLVRDIYGREGHNDTLYLRRVHLSPRRWPVALMLHIFHRGDEDPDPHDHPQGFLTMPLNGYWEEVLDEEVGLYWNYVRPWRVHYRPAGYTHRVIGRRGRRRIRTLVLFGPRRRHWGFWVKNPERAEKLRRQAARLTTSAHIRRSIARGDRVFVPWRDYIYHGGGSS